MGMVDRRKRKLEFQGPKLQLGYEAPRGEKLRVNSDPLKIFNVR